MKDKTINHVGKQNASADLCCFWKSVTERWDAAEEQKQLLSLIPQICNPPKIQYPSSLGDVELEIFFITLNSKFISCCIVKNTSTWIWSCKKKPTEAEVPANCNGLFYCAPNSKFPRGGLSVQD